MSNNDLPLTLTFVFPVGMPKSELVVNQPSPAPVEPEPAKVKRSKSKMKKEENKETASVTTAKTTLGHSATVAARDKAYQVYMYLSTHALHV